MQRSDGKFWVMSVAVGFLLHCSGGDGASTMTEASIGASTPDPSGTSGTDPSDSGSSEGIPTTGSGEPVDERAPCQRYVACVAATTPTELPAAQMGYGEDGSCWAGSAEMAAQCRAACRAGLAQLHEANQDEPACIPCEGDGDCDGAGGDVCSGAGDCVSRCVNGEPVGECECRIDGDCDEFSKCTDGVCGPAKCGDGVVQQGEHCDGQMHCDADCKGPLECTPLFNVGCPEFLRCTEFGYCDDNATPAGLGEPCINGNCAGGFWCSYDDLCHQFCAIGGDPCLDGTECVLIGLDPPLDYLGRCGI